MSDDNIIRRTLDVTRWSQAELGRRIGVHKDTVQDWAQGRSKPRAGVYIDLMRELLQMQQQIDDLVDDLKQVGSG